MAGNTPDPNAALLQAIEAMKNDLAAQIGRIDARWGRLEVTRNDRNQRNSQHEKVIKKLLVKKKRKKSHVLAEGDTAETIMLRYTDKLAKI